MAVGPLFALDILLMAVLLGVVGAAMSIGFEMPRNMIAEVKLTPAIVALFIIGAPIGEEILFRGWLSGRPGHVTGSLLAALAFALLAMGTRNTHSPGADLWSFGALGILAAAGLFVFLLRGRPAMGWFQRHFIWFYWASVLLFAVVHLNNFVAPSPTMLPLVLPQFALATILGYLRVMHGLWSSVLLHMLHNSVFVALVLVGSSAG